MRRRTINYWSRIISLLLILIMTIPMTTEAATSSVPGSSTPSISTPSTSIPRGVSSVPQGTEKKDSFSWKSAAIYYLITDRFNNGDPSNDESYGRKKVDAYGQSVGTFNGGDFKGITDKLKEGYFKDLGINALWISAPYEQIHGFVSGGRNGEFAHYAYHGYYPLDYTMTDRNFGTVEEFREMVDTAHSQGIRIILDVVMNHTGYNTIKDMEEFSFGKLNGIDSSWKPGEGENYSSYHKYIDYKNEKSWSTWWGKDWIRAGLPGYEEGGGNDLTMNLSGLPDVKTESMDTVDIPPVLKTKWSKEDSSFDLWRLPEADYLRQKKDLPPSGYITTWLCAWVKEFGIDGFRIDTAKHVDMDVWENLKTVANMSLYAWRENNPGRPGADFTESFYMVGEVWGKGTDRTPYMDKGFDALINFTFQGEGTDGPAYKMNTMGSVFSTYTEKLLHNGFLSYISSHDTRLYPRNRLIDGITYLSLLPGAIEVFYGDETGRPYGESLTDVTQSTRSYMNWEKIDEKILTHAKKMLTFRKEHPSVGSGEHRQISSSPYIFIRSLADDTTVIALGVKEKTTVDVSDILKDGMLHDYYNDRNYTVIDGRIELSPEESGIILLGLMKDVR